MVIPLIPGNREGFQRTEVHGRLVFQVIRFQTQGGEPSRQALEGHPGPPSGPGWRPVSSVYRGSQLSGTRASSYTAAHLGRPTGPTGNGLPIPYRPLGPAKITGGGAPLRPATRGRRISGHRGPSDKPNRPGPGIRRGAGRMNAAKCQHLLPRLLHLQDGPGVGPYGGS